MWINQSLALIADRDNELSVKHARKRGSTMAGQHFTALAAFRRMSSLDVCQGIG